jgi:hypothetical protein
MPIAGIAPRAGKNSLVYINASEIEGGNAWSLEIEHDVIELTAFGDDWRKIIAGMRSWGGSIDAWHDQEARP